MVKNKKTGSVKRASFCVYYGSTKEASGFSRSHELSEKDKVFEFDEVIIMKHCTTATTVPASRTDVKRISITALFAAVIFLGIQSFRIPLPAAVGTPFLHFGHIFVMMAILCLGAKRSTVAGVLGLIIFDILNGYLHSIPGVFVSTIIKCMLVGTVYDSLKKKANGDTTKEYTYAIACAALYGVTNIVLIFSGPLASCFLWEVRWALLLQQKSCQFRQQ